MIGALTHRRITVLAAAGSLLALTACSVPGAVAPSTVPLTGPYVELGPIDEATSCGYTALFIPISNPKPVPDIIQDLVSSRGGKALIQVSSSSSSLFYLVGIRNCVTIKGKVVNFTK
ncbi:MAG TPA: hypothetical protein VFA38_00580 [Nitrospirales bacterium]|nr:hypothetical protein [Nitrospirales bacterium]